MSDIEGYISDEHFIDDNDYSFDTDSQHSESDTNSVELIDIEDDTESNNPIDDDITDHDPQEDNGSNDIEEEVSRLQSEHNYDSKPEIKPLLNDHSLYSTQTDNGDNSCIICTEIWTTSGEHQLVSLSCGHLFGRKCIEQWLDPKLKQNHRCPHCNKAAKKKDIRVLYARNLRALDTSERDRALEGLEKERIRREKAELETNKIQIKLKSVLKENERLKKECMECQQKIQLLSSNSRFTEKSMKSMLTSSVPKSQPLFQLVKDIQINSSGNCRHLGYSSLLEVITVSQPNPHQQLMAGYGVKKIFLNDFSKTDHIPIHQKPIRDLEVNAYDGTILTTSLDKSVKLTSLVSKQKIIEYKLDVDAWSVAFDPTNKNQFFVGLNSGTILLFDSRHMASHVEQIKCLDSSPVVCLNPIEFDSSVGHINGLLSTQFFNFCLYERTSATITDSSSSSHFIAHNIPIEGRFGSAHFEPKLGLALLSCRPSSKHTNATHYVMDFKASVDPQRGHKFEPEVVSCLEGGKQQIKLSRSRIFRHPSDQSSALVCAGDESSKGTLIWDLNSGKCVQRLDSPSPVLDISLLNDNANNHFITTLTDTSVKFYKYISQ